MEAISAGKGRKPKPFMQRGGKVHADAVWDSRSGLTAEECKADREKKAKAVIASDLPDFIAPQLCETLDRPPSADGWIHEIKFDGYRIQMRVLNGEVTLKTRRGLDWTTKFPAIAKAAGKLPDAIIGGEICALDENGAPDFGALQPLSSVPWRRRKRGRMNDCRPSFWRY
jgi:bifunctional non-homologous end joining protein LigD